MERIAIFDEYREQVAQDHRNIQEFARASIDRVVNDAVTATRRFAGFHVVKTAQAQIEVAAGRVYDTGGAIYVRASVLVQSMVPHLAAAAKRIVALTASGVEVETEPQTRWYVVVDPDNPPQPGGPTQLEPESVSTVRARQAVLHLTAGTESADPQPPAIPVGHVAIAYILVDPTQVVSIAMIDANRVTSTEGLDLRTRDLESFRASVDPRMSSLAAELAALAARLAQLGFPLSMVRLLVEDMARVKERLAIPEDATGYHADSFLLPTKSDIDDDAELGFDAKVAEGIRFADANANEFEIALFSANDPNASVTGGLLLPKFSSELRLSTGPYHSDIGIAQFGFQTVEMKVGYMSRDRLRYGGSYSVCTNGAHYGTAGEPTRPANLYDFATWELVQNYVEYVDPANPSHQWIRQDRFWFDSWKEPYVYAQTVDHSILGALVAQSFLVANEFWATRLGFYLTVKAANEAVHLTLCEVSGGVPDPTRAVAYVSVPHGDLQIGWNRVAIPPTFLKGRRYALIAMSNANHKFGLSNGQSYLEGTFFSSTDGAYFLGDLTKDLMIEVWGAKFDSPQVVIEFEPISLDGGFRTIDILAESIVPESTALIYEIRPSAAGAWLPLTKGNLAALNGAPALAQFRARFVGAADMMPALKLTGSRVHVARPKTTFKHVSIPLEFATPTDSVVVKLIAERFSETPHDFSCTLRHGVTNETADSTVTRALPDLPEIPGRVERTFTFSLGEEISEAIIIIDGSTNSAANTFHISERIDYALPT